MDGHLEDWPLRVGFVTGATPDKWARVYRGRISSGMELVPLTEDAQTDGLVDRTLDMALVRLPVDRDGLGLHCIPLYEELPVAVMGHEHLLSLLEEVSTEDLAEEQLVLPERSGWVPAVEQLPWPPMSEKDAVETVAAGTGVAVVPMSVARLYHRRDATHRVVTDLPGTKVGLAWLKDRDEDPRIQAFIGVVRGRTARSSR
ncbi:LysR family transcriptional regulator substrate-binding protein [Nocardioides bruguierae]|uniref:LysR family transcriptional regulator substrate-binding protein n=1 Tax=Nocardioides bruguierae TaxID=2945102 RepID=A0A9X2D432_9ACTN|nr:LysR family transcriptional regulator substrate-binding protein [Nocardioides bruguierae]MCL8025843.1 LysR family transcriptional regulator substrate-binding protein [Nocardioides bruguierae]MCM0618958.1 LysR family transcriptional regulator substrate-binding protein [Nocardioides bruguierae]